VKQEFANRRFILNGRCPDGTFVSMFWIVFSVEHLLYWPHRRCRCYEVRRLAADQRDACEAIRHWDAQMGASGGSKSWSGKPQWTGPNGSRKCTAGCLLSLRCWSSPRSLLWD